MVLLIVILVWAGWIDPLRETNPVQRATNAVPALADENIKLDACATNQESYAGPRPMDDRENPTQVTKTDTKSYLEIPMDEWTYQIGFSISTLADPIRWAKILGSGWYLDWRVNPRPAAEGLVYWPMIRVHEKCISPAEGVIQEAALEHPGQVWIIGNEPDVIWQDNAMPEKYAMAYHALYSVIKNVDPSAKIAAGGIAQATPIRLRYLDQVLESYQAQYGSPMPVDWWTVHGYVLREEKGAWGVDIPPGINATQGELREMKDHGNIEIFEQQIIAFRRWMDENGYQHTPLALTEFGILMPATYGFTPELIAEYLRATFTWLSQATDNATGFPGDSYHLVQKWAWFSLADPLYPSADLANLSAGNLTLVGEGFRDFILHNGK